MSKRNLTDADIEALVDVLERRQGHTCRFSNIKAQDLESTVEFCQNFNRILGKTGETAWNTAVRIIVTIGLGAIGIGLYILFKKQGSGL